MSVSPVRITLSLLFVASCSVGDLVQGLDPGMVGAASSSSTGGTSSDSGAAAGSTGGSTGADPSTSSTGGSTGSTSSTGAPSSTGGASAAVVTFNALGDFGEASQTDANLEQLVDNPADIFLGLGDYDYEHDQEAWWEDYLARLSYPMHLCRGNHDDDDFYELADQPGWNHTTVTGHLQAFDLNSEEGVDGGQIEAAITALVGNPPGTYEVLLVHHPPFTLQTRHDNEPGLQEDICEIMQSVDVDHVLAGHNHNFQQSTFLRCDEDGEWEVTTEGDPLAFVYTLSGMGGRENEPYEIEGRSPLIQWWTDTDYGFLNVEVDAGTQSASLKYIQTDGKVISLLAWVYD